MFPWPMLKAVDVLRLLLLEHLRNPVEAALVDFCTHLFPTLSLGFRHYKNERQRFSSLLPLQAGEGMVKGKADDFVVVRGANFEAAARGPVLEEAPQASKGSGRCRQTHCSTRKVAR